MICKVGRQSLPLAPNQISPARFREPGATLGSTSISNEVLPAVCSRKYLECYTVSRKHGIVIDWCANATSEPCAKTDQYTWSGNVCKANAQTCNPIEQMSAAWTGPFKCKTKIKVCDGSTQGTYEIDTISIGKTPPRLTKRYLYKQEILLSGTFAAYVGLNVGP